jgi:hypothetical protein
MRSTHLTSVFVFHFSDGNLDRGSVLISSFAKGKFGCWGDPSSSLLEIPNGPNCQNESSQTKINKQEPNPRPKNQDEVK